MHQTPQSSSWVVWAIGIGSVIIFAGLVMMGFKPAPTKLSTRELAMICTTDMATEFHIHPRLTIIANGASVELPKDVGVVEGCMNPLHTHDNTGSIHVESPEKRDFTLGDFFAVWKKPFHQNQILDFVADQDHKVRMTVNGQDSSEFENLVLRDEDQIVILYDEKK